MKRLFLTIVSHTLRITITVEPPLMATSLTRPLFWQHSPYIDSCLNVAKCNLGKVNLEAMLVSCFPSYSRGGPMPLAGAPRDLYTQLLACSSSQSVVAIACCLRASFCFGFFSTAATSLQSLLSFVPKVAIVERFNCISVYSKML